MISFAAICPHPPIIIPGIGRGVDLRSVQNTIDAMERLACKLKQASCTTLIIISPHAPIAIDTFLINSAQTLDGDFRQFGRSLSLSFANNLTLVKKIQSINIATGLHESRLDHGALVPLYYLIKDSGIQNIVHLSFSFLDLATHKQYGAYISDIITTSKEPIAVVASGDLSHRLTHDAPAGYCPRGKEFDQTLMHLLEEKDTKSILELNKDFIEQAGECGLRSIIILLGILEKERWSFEKLCYEGPFGVGYLTAKLF